MMRHPLANLTRILRRRELAARAGGRLLARRVEERRRPKLLAASTRLARQPRADEAVPAEQPVQAPSGFSEFAARWLFGDGQVEGVPFAGAATVGSMGERPSFLDPPPERPASASRGATGSGSSRPAPP